MSVLDLLSGPIWFGIGLLLCVALAYLARLLREPFNGVWHGASFKAEGDQWWLGSANLWLPVELQGEMLLTPWLVVVTLQSPNVRRAIKLWLWRDGVGAQSHRHLRTRLLQGNH